MILSISTVLQVGTICLPNAASQLPSPDFVSEIDCELCHRNMNETVRTGMEVLFKINRATCYQICIFCLNSIKSYHFDALKFKGFFGNYLKCKLFL